MHKVLNWEDLRSGSGDKIVPVGLAGPINSDELSLALVELTSDGPGVEPHFHRSSTEVFLIVEGTGFATVNGESVPIAAGSILLMERDDVHSVEATSEKLSFWAISSPPWTPEDHHSAEVIPI
ncbi:cupin domain-containing protein [Microbacterium sp. 2216-1]|uniref:cupin domain-containing protein n=1 Tax=Microbacterium sp. 2216-1 TaxID=3390053 RepID=UPI00397713DE